MDQVDGNGLTVADQFRLERVMERGRQFYNLILVRVCQLYPDIGEAVEETDRNTYCHFIVQPGEIEEYWKELQGISFVELHDERDRLYEKRSKAQGKMEAFPRLFAALWGVTREEDEPSCLRDFGWTWDDFWRSYLQVWGLCLRLPIWNRLRALTRREHFFDIDEVPPDSLIELVEEEESEAQVGRNPDEVMWARRRRLVVQLLLAEEREFDTLTEFYATLAGEDKDGWRYDVSSVRQYFDMRLDVPRPSTMQDWEELASWFQFELATGIDLGGPPTWREE